MGFFSRHKTYYSSTSVKLFEAVPSLLSQTIKVAVAQNRNIASDLTGNLVNGIYYQAKGLYNYGLTGGYPWGLPNGTAATISPERPDKVKIIIERLWDEPIYLNTCVIDIAPNSHHLMYEATYYLLDVKGNTTGELQTWSYDESTNEHPILDLELTDIQDVSPYYPIIPIRRNNVSTVATDGATKIAVKKACKYLGIDAEELNDAVEEQDDGIEDAYIMLGVEITNDTAEGMAYIYSYFEHMLSVSEITKAEYLAWKAAGRTNTTANGNTTYMTYASTCPYNSVIIKDDNYKMQLGWVFIEQEIVTGTIGSVGTHKVIYGVGGEQDVGDSQTYSTSGLMVYKQIAPNQYSTLYIHGLTHSNWAVGHELRTTLNDAFDDPEGLAQAFIIPLRKDITTSLGAVRQHDLMYSAIRMVVNDKKRTKLKWYQTGFFQVFTLVIAMALSYFTSGATLAMWATTVLPTMIAMMILMKIALPIVMPYLEDLIGEELALAVVVIVMYLTSDMDANALVQTGLVAVNGAVDIYFKDALQDIYDELETLTEDYSDLLEEQAEVDAAIALTNNMTKGDSYAIMKTDNYVRKFKLNNQLPTMTTAMTEHYVSIMQFVDRPDSYIRLGNS